MQRLLAGLMTVCAVGTIGACHSPTKDTSTAIVRANAQAERYLGSFEPVEGTSYLVAPIGSPKKGESWIKGKYEISIEHNYVFFNTDDESTTPLLPTNDYMITQKVAFPEKRPGANSGPATQWFLYVLVKADTDGDKELSYEDKRTVAVSDAGGRGYTELIENVEDVLGHSMRDPNTLFVIYVSDATKNVAKIDLANRRVTSIRALPQLGRDVR